MAHHALKDNYRKLSDRINLFPQGAPPGELLARILSVLFSEKEAGLISRLPIKPFTASAASKIWKYSEKDSRAILEDLASRGMILDMETDESQFFVLPPPMAGFFEFSLMRIGGRYDQKLLAELYYEYLNVEEEFVKELFTGTPTELGRVFVNEKALSSDNIVHVLDYERASNVIKTASHIGVGTCYCRHKMEHMGKACSAPLDICLTFNSTASSLIKHSIARKIDVQEGLAQLDRAIDNNLVQFGENVQERVSFICNCCGCCCEALLAAKRFAAMNTISTANFIPAVLEEKCSGCGKCAQICPVEAMGLVSSNDPQNIKKKKAKLNADLCLGCGVCARVCPSKSIELESRKKRIITPVNTAHRVVLMAIEKGKLQNLIFDNQAFINHRAMAAILGVILKLPPVKQIMASDQMKSKYLRNLLSQKAFEHK